MSCLKFCSLSLYSQFSSVNIDDKVYMFFLLAKSFAPDHCTAGSSYVNIYNKKYIFYLELFIMNEQLVVQQS